MLFAQAQPYIVCCLAGWKIGVVLALDDLYASKVSVDLLPLIYIHAVLWDYRQSLELRDQYVGWLQSHIEETSNWKGSIETLLWILLSLRDSGSSQNSKRIGFILRMSRETGTILVRGP
jgi:hypothetical protein